ncbi:hypothetical protein [Capnocytophaga stomatis]|uniref:GyrI-like small molecule binding domain-containing protein n=1 Tax=Capnocytophaga stomatis TaxID=1848904 RepID=A0ABW8QA74_9FLAO|nr:hypothetical protein [Capnocytophaga stomatis]GIJ93992.1 hypothetical protein CAPN002_12100 [Capnocytophaga stomatis]GIM48616.1 hypothetical protein CAPN003_00680 [Capnocytophaga stomatis]
MKKPINFSISKEIIDIKEIPGNHPNQNPERGFLYIEKSISDFEDSFDELFDIKDLEPLDYCILSSNCEITLPSGKKFCGVSFKGTSGKEKITQTIQKDWKEKGFLFGEIRNNIFTDSEGKKTLLNLCKAVLYEY